MKTLLVLRHAKSDWDASYEADHERPLNRRGERAARHVGTLVRDLGLTPDLVISSTAVRARTTAQMAMEEGGWDSEFVLEPDLYHSNTDTVVEIVSRSGEAARVMVVGHQPTWGSLVYRLTGMPAEIKTATLAVIDLGIEGWADLPGNRGELRAVHHPPHE